jgi:hypothetical protein
VVSALPASGDRQGGNWREALNFWKGKGDCSDGPAEMESPTYNILPLEGPAMIENAAMNFPEVQAAIAALRAVGELSIPPELRWNPEMDLLDWLGALFGFQRDNVRNQREHLVLLLANAQMQLYQDGMSWDKVNLRNATFCSFQRLWCNHHH